MGDEEIVREAINGFYVGAGVNKKFTGAVNDKVANIFGVMLNETKKCSDSFVWIPTPPGGGATVSWVARVFARSMINKLRNSSSLTCAKAVIYKWGRELDSASFY